MKAPFFLVLLCFPLLLLAPDAFGAINPGIVSADAQWVVFADVNALRQSTLGREVIAAFQQKLQPRPYATPVEFDLQRLFATIGSVTDYGTTLTSKANLVDGALVIEGTGDLRKIAEGCAAQAALTHPDRVGESKDLPFSGYVLGRDLIVGFPTEPIIIIGKSAAHVIKARDVYRGQALSLARSLSSPLTQLLAKAGNAYGVAASIVPPEISGADAPQARILQLIGSGIATLGEENQRTSARADLIAKSDDGAGKLDKIVQGLAAMLSLTETNGRQLAEFLQSAKVEKHDRTVSVRVSYSSDRLAQMIQKLEQRGPQPPAPGQIRKDFGGTVVAEWKLDQAPAGAAPGAEQLVDHPIANVHLVTGATITISGQRASGSRNNALIDRVEIFPMAGGPGLRFEAENMRLRGFGPRNAPWASGGRVIAALGYWAFAQFEFPGGEGDYMIHVRHVDESAGTTTLAVSVTPPGVATPR